MKRKVKLANFDDPKWTYNDLKIYARKYRDKLKNKHNVRMEIVTALTMYQCQSREILIKNLKIVQAELYH